jgi:hypothetical protein
MAYENSQTKSQPVQQNDEPDCTQPNLSESDIGELVRFFQLLEKWDRQYRLKVAQEGKAL